MPKTTKVNEKRDPLSSRNSMLESITRIDKNKEVEYQPKTTFYNNSGVEANNLDNNTATAVQITIGPKVIYKVKSKRGGKLYNPIQDSSNYGLNKIDKSSKETMFHFREVGNSCFNAYLKFLKTRNDSYLISAEREK